MDHYGTSLEHLLAELERINLLILAQVRQTREKQHTDPALQGLYISEADVDEILARTAGVPRWAPIANDVQAAMDQLASKIIQRKMRSAGQNFPFRLDEIIDLFHLNPFERDALLICLAPELDLSYERLYAYLQDDVTKKRPSVELILNLLCLTREAKVANRQNFTSSASLIKHHLLQIFDDPSQPHPPLIGRFLKMDARIADYLLDSDEMDARLQAHVTLVTPQISLDQILLPDDQKQRLKIFAQEASILYFQGAYGAGRQSTAEALCRELRLKLLRVDGDTIQNLDLTGFEALVNLIIREAQLQKAAIFWHSFDLMLGEERTVQCSTLFNALAEQPILTFLAGDTAWEPAGLPNVVNFVRIEFPKPNYTERLQLWSKQLDGNPADIAAVANKFRFSGGQIRDAVGTARNLARRSDPQNGKVSMADIYTACRLHSNRKLSALAQKIQPHYRWDDIILPADRLEQLQDVCNHVRYRGRVYGDWAFDRKLSLGKGLNVLFAGPSGTGKTMAAEIIAGELGLDLYKIDLSMVISKYIGETEKNLARIFAEAETSNAILFFDEADALFGKRSEVRDAHDRYANIEVAYLLQKMEEYDGVVILATNLRRNMDDAFVRRMHFAVEFPFPNEQDRQRIWQSIWPAETPLQPNLDLAFMAQRFEIAGGNIRNIALAAAFFAAADGQYVNMAHLIRAIKREYQKMGKVVVDGEFGEYAGLVKT